MEERNLAVVIIDTISLKRLIHLPAEMEICDIDYDIQARRLMIKMEGPGLPAVREGQMIPAMLPTLTEHVTPDGFHKVEWAFNFESQVKVDA